MSRSQAVREEVEMPKECKHLFVKIEALSVKETVARMIPVGYYCL